MFWVECKLSSLFTFHLSTKKNLKKLASIYDLNLFMLNALGDPNPGDSLYNHRIHNRNYSSYSFYKKVNFPVVSLIRASLFFIIISGVLTGQNLENFQFHPLDELNFEFSIIGVSETKIISGKEIDMFLNMFRHL